MPDQIPDEILRLPAVQRHTGKSVAQIYRDMAEGTFPRSVTLGPNARGWLKSEIIAWQQERIAARDSGGDADLRAVNPHIGRGRPRKRRAEAAA